MNARQELIEYLQPPPLSEKQVNWGWIPNTREETGEKIFDTHTLWWREGGCVVISGVCLTVCYSDNSGSLDPILFLNGQDGGGAGGRGFRFISSILSQVKVPAGVTVSAWCSKMKKNLLDFKQMSASCHIISFYSDIMNVLLFYWPTFLLWLSKLRRLNPFVGWYNSSSDFNSNVFMVQHRSLLYDFLWSGHRFLLGLRRVHTFIHLSINPSIHPLVHSANQHPCHPVTHPHI